MLSPLSVNVASSHNLLSHLSNQSNSYGIVFTSEIMPFCCSDVSFRAHWVKPGVHYADTSRRYFNVDEHMLSIWKSTDFIITWVFQCVSG